MARIFLIPGEGLIVPSPDHHRQPLKATGAWVESSTYWAKRLRDEEVTDGTAEETKREASASKKS